MTTVELEVNFALMLSDRLGKYYSGWRERLDEIIESEFKNDHDHDWEVKNKIGERFREWASMESCNHAFIPVKFIIAGGGVRYQKQCNRCGKTTEQISKKSVDHIPPDRLDPALIWDMRWEMDGEARDYLDKRLSDFFAVARAKDTRAFWDRYTEYLKSPEWQIKRRNVLVRDANVCKAILEGCTRRATEVHHKTYEHVFDEPLWDLESVCHNCHEKITERERENRDNGSYR